MSNKKSILRQFSVISLLQISVFSWMVLLVSCTSEEENISSVHPIFIETHSMPKNVRINETAAIHVRATAPNGCYSNLKVKMSISANRKILISSTAVSRSSGACPNVIIEHDTVLYFTPALKGEYYFQFNDSPLPIYVDTLAVNN